jgi:uncharacterized protein
MSTSFTRLAGCAPISTYRGAFHFGSKRHQGALLVSPAGIYDWTSSDAGFSDDGLLRFLACDEAKGCDVLLIGTGPSSILPPASFAAQIEERGLGLEAMETAAACRTYNILLAENRHFLAALLPL